MSRIVTFGEIMARLEPPGYQRFQQAMPGSLKVTFAGSEASIAASYSYLGGEATFVTALPYHEIAKACLADLRSLGVNTRNIVRTHDGRLGLYYFERGVNQRTANVIYDRDGSSVSITPAEDYDWDRIFEQADWFVISGITPAISRNAATVSRIAIEEAARRNVRICCDMNYRSKLWKWDPSLSSRELAGQMMRQLLPSVDLLIAGHEDLTDTLGYAPHADHKSLIQPLIAEFPKSGSVAMSRRASASASVEKYGGLLYDVESDQVHYAPSEHSLYEINPIIDRLGAGDAFTAGLLFAMTTAELADPKTAIQFATAAGCLAHSNEGDYHYSSRAEIEILMTGNASGRVRR
jgi:2-dehydro-3-deoxygluconokinase